MNRIVIALFVFGTGCTQMADADKLVDPWNIDPDFDDMRDDVDGVYGIQPGTLPGYEEPMVAVSISRIAAFGATTVDLVGYGNGGSNDWWTWGSAAEFIAIDRDSDGVGDDEIVAARVWESDGTSFRVNFRSNRTECMDQEFEDVDSFKCWADLTKDIGDPLVVSYASSTGDSVESLCFVVRNVVDEESGKMELNLFEDPDGCEATGEPS